MESSVSWFQLIVLLVVLLCLYVLDLARRTINEKRKQRNDERNLNSLQHQITILQKEAARLNSEIKRVASLPPVMIVPEEEKAKNPLDTSPVKKAKGKLPPPPSDPPSEGEGQYLRVLEMMEQGYDTDAIAKACSLSQSEVDLMVSLYRKPKDSS